MAEDKRAPMMESVSLKKGEETRALSLPCEDTAGRLPPANEKRALPRNQNHQHLEVGPHSLQNDEKYLLVI